MDASVVITCYNLERFIGAAIESVQRQDFAGSLQIIVVHDCCTDRSAEVIQSFDGVEYVAMPSNQGALLATLAGLERARSDIVFFLDGDDLWESGKFREVLPRFTGDPAVGFVTHDLAYADENGRT